MNQIGDSGDKDDDDDKDDGDKSDDNSSKDMMEATFMRELLDEHEPTMMNKNSIPSSSGSSESNPRTTTGTTTATTTSMSPSMTGRPPRILYLSCDPDHLNDYQCLIRKHMEFFEASPFALQVKVRGRIKPIVLGQVGLRCIYCGSTGPSWREGTIPHSPSVSKKSVYYPQTLLGIYPAAQTLANHHWIADQDYCSQIQPIVRQQMQQLKMMVETQQPSAGRKYWADNAAVLGIYEHKEWGLRFEPLVLP